MTFQKATRSQVFLKLALTGPTGSGKTFSALRLAMGLVADTGKRIAFLDTENDSASLYSDAFDFDVMPIAPPFAAEEFSRGIREAVKTGEHGVVIIDSASHLWKGILAYKDQIDSHGKGNSYTNWKQADAKMEPVIEDVLHSKIHVIFCMRSKMDYAQEEVNGKKTVKKIGLAPIMRDGMEYEFSTVLDIGLDHSAQSSKDRTGLFPTDKIFQITEDTGKEIAAWLKTATPKPEPEPAPIITDEQAKAGNITKLRAFIAKQCKPEELTAYECVFSGHAAAGCKDNRDRNRLDEFTLEELRLIYPDKERLAKLIATNAVAKP